MARADSTKQETLFDTAPAQKACNKCGKPKPIELFNRNPRMRGGRLHHCRDCEKVRRLAKRSTRQDDVIQSGITVQRCLKCGEIKTLTDFYKSLDGKYGRESWCKACRSTATKKHRKRLKLDPQWAQRRYECHRKEHMKKYGITRDEYMVMHAAQNGLCAICGKPETAKRRGNKKLAKELSVDHNHRTGKVRSLLCGRCNNGIGNFCENVDFLKSAISYLERHAEKDT